MLIYKNKIIYKYRNNIFTKGPREKERLRDRLRGCRNTDLVIWF